MSAGTPKAAARGARTAADVATEGPQSTIASDPIGGALPPSWRLTTIGELCDENGGEVQTGPFGSQLHADDYVSNGVPSVMPKDIIGDRISTKSIARVSEVDAARLSLHRLRAGDVVYARRGDIGRRALVTAAEEGWLCGTGCLRIRLNAPDVSSDYLLTYLGHPRVRSWVESKAQGATMLNLNTSILRAVPFRVPPLSEQRRIADILDKADAIRRKRKQAIALTEELLRSTFLDMFGDPVTNPKGWEAKPFDTLVRETQLGLVRAASQQGPGRAFSYVRMNAIRDDGYLDLRRVTRVDATDAEFKSMRLLDGDFLFNTRNSQELVGKVAVFHDRGDYLYNNNIMRVRFKEGIDPDFVCSFWQTNAARRELDARKAGTTSVFAIYYKSLATLPVPVPPVQLQKRYGELCASVRTLLRAHQGMEVAAEELFNTLVQRAFRGELAELNADNGMQLGLFDGAIR